MRSYCHVCLLPLRLCPVDSYNYLRSSPWGWALPYMAHASSYLTSHRQTQSRATRTTRGFNAPVGAIHLSRLGVLRVPLIFLGMTYPPTAWILSCMSDTLFGFVNTSAGFLSPAIFRIQNLLFWYLIDLHVPNFAETDSQGYRICSRAVDPNS